MLRASRHEGHVGARGGVLVRQRFPDPAGRPRDENALAARVEEGRRTAKPDNGVKLLADRIGRGAGAAGHVDGEEDEEGGGGGEEEGAQHGCVGHANVWGKRSVAGQAGVHARKGRMEGVCKSNARCVGLCSAPQRCSYPPLSPVPSNACRLQDNAASACPLPLTLTSPITITITITILS